MIFSIINPNDFISFAQNESVDNERANDDVTIDINSNQSVTNDNDKEKEIDNGQLQSNSNDGSGSLRPDVNKLESLIEQSFKCFTNGFLILGPLFTISLMSFIIFTYIAIKKTIIPYWKRKYGRHITFVISIINTIQLFYILFNYLLATFIKPGSVKDILSSSYYIKHNKNPYKSSQVSFPSFDIPISSKEDSSFRWRICKSCNIIKPLRAHHCTICGYCVMKMDHHCPWINNCVGQNNQRYFLLFLADLFGYTLFTALLSIPMIYDGEFSKMENEFRFICVLSIAGTCLLTFFCSWNWFLAFNGNTTLEFWGSKTGVDFGDGLSDFDFGNWRDNLYYIFGSRSLLKILMIPSVSKLPFSGLEWSRFVDNNFKVNGINEDEYHMDNERDDNEIDIIKGEGKDKESDMMIELDNKNDDRKE